MELINFLFVHLVSFSHSLFLCKKKKNFKLTSDAAPSSAAFSTSQSSLPPFSPSTATASVRRGSGGGTTEGTPSTRTDAGSDFDACSSKTALAILPWPSQSSSAAPGRRRSTFRAWRASLGGKETTAPLEEEAAGSRPGSTKKRGGRLGEAAARFSIDDDDDEDELAALVAVAALQEGLVLRGSWPLRPEKKREEEVEAEAALEVVAVAVDAQFVVAAALAILVIASRISMTSLPVAAECVFIGGGRIRAVRVLESGARERD